MLETAVAAARRAGKELLGAWTGKIEVLSEDANDIKLVMDQRAEEIIVDTIRCRFPEHAILSEECGAMKGADVQWVVDPLDGTHNYYRRIPYWCTCIGAVRDGEPIVGVVYDPVHDHLFTAEKGKGAFLNGAPVRVSERSTIRGAVVAYGIYHRDPTSVRAWLTRTRAVTPYARSVRNLGAAGLHAAYVAAGLVEAFVQYGVWPWDVTAGFALVHEAGGKVSQWPVDDGAIDVVLATPGVHDELLATGLWPLPEEDARRG